MKRFLPIICLSFIFFSTSNLLAADRVVVIPLHSSSSLVQKTGQKTIYASNDDGQLQRGAESPTPRFIDYGNGTVGDQLTGLVWLKNGNCTEFYAGDPSVSNERNWNNAVIAAASLAEGYCGLSDDSSAGDWSLANIRELMTLLDYGNSLSMVPSDLPLIGPVDPAFWTSTTVAAHPTYAWLIDFTDGYSHNSNKTTAAHNVLCVRNNR